MKLAAIITLGLAASTQAFAPTPARNARTSTTTLEATLFDRILGMDLFEPKKDQNDYGARNKKDLSRGKITGKSYVPSGLDIASYQKIRNGEVAKKKANYERNVKKAGIFEDYTEFYTKRGTDLSQGWKKGPTLGHRMAKTKYDWSGVADSKKWITKGKK